MVVKLKNKAIKAGKKLIYAALLLYYTLQKDNVPLKAKSVIVGALGYFIAPIDAIPDFLPMIGYTDDFGALMMALAIVSMYVDNEAKSKAHTQLESWFGQGNESEIDEVNDKL
ncbi:MAG: hypothetical protein H6Q68_1620 [Firmicutes bacterium]|nr:hypothetical protein [Bacillota bacterium]